MESLEMYNWDSYFNLLDGCATKAGVSEKELKRYLQSMYPKLSRTEVKKVVSKWEQRQ